MSNIDILRKHLRLGGTVVGGDLVRELLESHDNLHNALTNLLSACELMRYAEREFPREAIEAMNNAQGALGWK